jgi:hypothetical protein
MAVCGCSKFSSNPVRCLRVGVSLVITHLPSAFSDIQLCPSAPPTPALMRTRPLGYSFLPTTDDTSRQDSSDVAKETSSATHLVLCLSLLCNLVLLALLARQLEQPGSFPEAVYCECEQWLKYVLILGSAGATCDSVQESQVLPRCSR